MLVWLTFVELVFIRHAEPAWVEGRRPQMDPVLTERGRAQAQLVAERIAASPRKPAEILVSSAKRSRETAGYIARATGVEPTVIPELIECRLPDWSELAPEEVATHFRTARHRKLDAWWGGLPGGESFHDFHARIDRSLREILVARGVAACTTGQKHLYQQDRDPGRVVIVAHGGTNSVAMSLLLGVEPVPWEWERMALHHASLIRFRTIKLGGGVVFSLRSHNDIAHLPKELRTR